MCPVEARKLEEKFTPRAFALTARSNITQLSPFSVGNSVNGLFEVGRIHGGLPRCLKFRRSIKINNWKGFTKYRKISYTVAS